MARRCAGSCAISLDILWEQSDISKMADGPLKSSAAHQPRLYFRHNGQRIGYRRLSLLRLLWLSS